MEIYIVSAAGIMACALITVGCRRYVARAFHAIDVVLDGILAKNPGVLAESTGENRLSKLTHKARRVTDMCALEVTHTKDEKEMIQGFLSDMSHQMKTPLAGIAMYANLLTEGHLSADEQREFSVRIKAGTDKLQWMMDSLVKMSRLEVGAIWLTPAPVRIKPTLSDAIGSVIALAVKKNINITVADFTDIPLLHDRKWTREAIANILENAVKYSAPAGEIEIAVEPMQLYTKITVTDYGIGIEKSDWHLIFKRFYRGQNVKDSEGAGLGLYLAVLIMEKQGGYIMVDSVPCHFTAFSLFLLNPQT